MSTVADGLVERLHEWGVRRVFGHAGGGVNPMRAALRRAQDEVALVTVRHEQTAIDCLNPGLVGRNAGPTAQRIWRLGEQRRRGS